MPKLVVKPIRACVECPYLCKTKDPEFFFCRIHSLLLPYLKTTCAEGFPSECQLPEPSDTVTLLLVKSPVLQDKAQEDFLMAWSSYLY